MVSSDSKNQNEDVFKEIFKRGSRTYFNSSIFFPKSVRRDVFILYGFVRVADDFVDVVPQKKEEFLSFCESYRTALSGEKVDDIIIDSFVDLMRRKDFDPQWVEDFLYAMELDLTKKNYNRLEETLEYIHGSAEVIGLFMAKILDLPKESYFAAERLGRAMQYINFIRDIKEDIKYGRRYLPLFDFNLNSLKKEETVQKKAEFKKFINTQIDYYFKWQQEAESGFKYIPKRYLIPIKTASDMYNWTALKIKDNPFIIYEEKVKPSKIKIFTNVLKNTFWSGVKANE
ncbi:MAG: phytoene/squalene synthase family protein [Candidatus Lokiarchaeota archaeon]|nr:phytoene/squalene synthase family protein [Candidatus Lokiarchaeota archaeon]MBD3199028.1 phytoene/squalene synthase family protein [Candidatus Lokiarchaeota archaeon]